MSARAMFQRSVLGITRCRGTARYMEVCTRQFSVDIPHVQENVFSKIEEEIKEKVLQGRVKDKPLPTLNNPFEKEKEKCILCQMNITPDYKNVKMLSQFVSPYTGQIYGRHITGLCTVKQKQVEQEVMKSQSSGLMACMMKDVTFLKDPKLFNPDRPIRPHRF